MFTLYLIKKEGGLHFLQKASDPVSLKVRNNQLAHWVAQMSLTLEKGDMLMIKASNDATWATANAQGRILWKSA